MALLMLLYIGVVILVIFSTYFSFIISLMSEVVYQYHGSLKLSERLLKLNEVTVMIQPGRLHQNEQCYRCSSVYYLCIPDQS